MKRLIAFMFCLAVLASFARAEYPQASAKTDVLQKTVNQRVKAAQQQSKPAQQQKKPAPVKINGEKRLVSVTLEVPEFLEDGTVYYHYWFCPAVIFTKNGALAFDGECRQAFDKAQALYENRTVNFIVNLAALGEYTTGKKAGQDFFFSAAYVADEGDEDMRSIDQVFSLSDDGTYFVYKRLLFNDPNNEHNVNNSEVKKAIAKYYIDNGLKDVSDQTLSAYFKQQHPQKEVSDDPKMHVHPVYD